MLNKNQLTQDLNAAVMHNFVTNTLWAEVSKIAPFSIIEKASCHLTY